MKEKDYLNNIETTYYQIGDIIFKITNDFPYPIPDGNMSNFRIEKTPADYTYTFKKVDNIPSKIGKTRPLDYVLSGHDLVNEQGEYFRAFLWKNLYYDTVVRFEETGGTIYYLSAHILAERFQNGFDFFNYLGAEYAFSKSAALVLHSSHIVVDGEAILFSAPSGTGKSTQADLWKQYAHAKIINGDRTLLRKKGETWYAYGCPMCGSSNIHLQSASPVKGIIMLEQGVSNILKPLKPLEAFRLIYPQITTQTRNPKIVLKNTDLIQSLISEVPIWNYSCTKTMDSVKILKDVLN